VTEPQRWPFPIQHKPCPTCGKPLVPGHIHTCTPPELPAQADSEGGEA